MITETEALKIENLTSLQDPPMNTVSTREEKKFSQISGFLSDPALSQHFAAHEDGSIRAREVISTISSFNPI
jgi:hypothetical protein